MTDAPFAQPLRKTMNDPRFDWARPQKMRRRLVTLFALLVLVQPALIVATGHPLGIILLLALGLPTLWLAWTLPDEPGADQTGRSRGHVDAAAKCCDVWPVRPLRVILVPWGPGSSSPGSFNDGTASCPSPCVLAAGSTIPTIRE